MTNTDNATVIDTPQGIAFVQLLTIIHRLKIEQATGLRSRVSTLKAAQRLYGLGNLRTKAAMLAHLEVVRDLVKHGDHVLLPVGDGTIGLYANEDLVWG